MSGPKKADVQLRLNSAIQLAEKFGQVAWEDAKRHNDSERSMSEDARRKAENLVGKTNISSEGQTALDQGRHHQRQVELLLEQAEKARQDAAKKMQTAQTQAEAIKTTISAKNERENFRTEYNQAENCASLARDAERLGQKAIDFVRDSALEARRARESYNQVAIIIEQKEEEKRRREMQRATAAEDIKSAKNEFELFGAETLEKWGADPILLGEIQKNILLAEKSLSKEQFAESREYAAASVKMIRTLYGKSLENQKKVESRNIITKAIVEALNDLQYDKPDVRYVPNPKNPSENNAKLGNITIFAKSPGETGDMRIAIDLDGKVDLDISNIPAGKELECHQRILEMQKKASSVIDLEITDWGRAADVKQETKGGMAGGLPKQKEKERERER